MSTEYYLKNKEKIFAKQREWRLKNPDKVKIHRQQQKEWRLRNKEKLKIYWQRWVDKNPDYYKYDEVRRIKRHIRWIKEKK